MGRQGAHSVVTGDDVMDLLRAVDLAKVPERGQGISQNRALGLKLLALGFNAVGSFTTLIRAIRPMGSVRPP